MASGPRGGSAHPLAVNGSTTIAGVGAGARAVTLEGVMSNCAVADGVTHTILVELGGTTEMVFNIGCVAFGTVQMALTTTGINLDPDGYIVSLHAPSVSFSLESSAPLNASLTFERLRPADDYHLSLNGVSANCTVAGGFIRAFALNASDTVQATFAVTCEPARRFAFVRSGDIYTMASDGTGQTRLTADAAMGRGAGLVSRG